MADPLTLTPRVSIELIEGPVDEQTAEPIEGAGAVLAFRGVVRPLEDGRLLSGLSYTSYDPMAEQQLRRIAEHAADTHGLLHVRIIHSRGFVPTGGASLLIKLASAHRKPALAAMDAILDNLKRDVPIWKRPVWADEQELEG